MPGTEHRPTADTRAHSKAAHTALRWCRTVAHLHMAVLRRAAPRADLRPIAVPRLEDLGVGLRPTAARPRVVDPVAAARWVDRTAAALVQEWVDRLLRAAAPDLALRVVVAFRGRLPKWVEPKQVLRLVGAARIRRLRRRIRSSNCSILSGECCGDLLFLLPVCVNTSVLTAPGGRGFHEKAGVVNTFLLTHPLGPTPTNGRRHHRSPFHHPLRKVFLSPRRFALLPFALLVEPSAPVPVGVLPLTSGAAISVPNWTPL